VDGLINNIIALHLNMDYLVSFFLLQVCFSVKLDGTWFNLMLVLKIMHNVLNLVVWLVVRRLIIVRFVICVFLLEGHPVALIVCSIAVSTANALHRVLLVSNTSSACSLTSRSSGAMSSTIRVGDVAHFV
jgi:hypothetical protein